MSALVNRARSLDKRTHSPAFWAAVEEQLTQFAMPPPYAARFSECPAANTTLPLVVATLLAAGLPHVTSVGVIAANRRDRKQFEVDARTYAVPRRSLAVVSGSGIIRGFSGDLVLVSKRALSDQLIASVIEPLLRISSTRVIVVD